MAVELQEAPRSEAALWLPRSKERALRRRAERRLGAAFDEQALEWCCMADEMEFVRYGPMTEREDSHYLDEDDYYFFQDNGADILAVAHLDSVDQKNRFFRIEGDPQRGAIVCSPTLDDRLGAYVILELLPKLGIKYDILLTVGEEKGRSTARYFKPPQGRQYNWMFQFDRMGSDVVMYYYHTKAREELLRSVHAWPARGAFSDICYLEDLGCAGFNWGVGYHDYHGPRAWASLNEMLVQTARFVRFYDRYRNLPMSHQKPKPVSNVKLGKGKWSGWMPGRKWDMKQQCYVEDPDTKVVAATKKKEKNKGSSGAAPSFRERVSANGLKAAINERTIPEIDEQLKGRKRGSRRGGYTVLDPYDVNIEFERCPICNAIVEGDGECDACGWDQLAPDSSRTDHVYGMTEAEWTQYDQMAEQQLEMDQMD